jgi:hypothetical protein
MSLGVVDKDKLPAINSSDPITWVDMRISYDRRDKRFRFFDETRGEPYCVVGTDHAEIICEIIIKMLVKAAR